MTPEEHRQLKSHKVIKETLDKNFVSVEIKNLEVHEDLKGDDTNVKTEISLAKEKKDLDAERTVHIIDATGDGVVDALVNGIQEALSNTFNTVEHFQIASFEIDALIDRDYKSDNKADSYVNVELSIYNSYGQRLYFTKTDRSMLKASVAVVKNAFEYLLNCELTVKKLKECIDDADERHRHDLKSHFISKLSDLVRTTSYHEL